MIYSMVKYDRKEYITLDCFGEFSVVNESIEDAELILIELSVSISVGLIPHDNEYHCQIDSFLQSSEESLP